MSHDITKRENGTAEAAFAFTPAWHNLGMVVDHAMTSAEALEFAQLDWRVVQSEAAFFKPGTFMKGFPNHGTFTPSIRGNFREDTGLFLGAVSDRYQVVQNVEAFEFCDALLADGEMKYETAFSLGGGKQVVITAELPKTDLIVDGDELKRYILMSLSHDGTSAIKFGVTTVRVVCANTFGLALEKDGKTIKDLSIRHTGKIDEQLQRAREILQLANGGFEANAAIARKLAEKQMARDEWQRMLDILCPIPDAADPDYTETRLANIEATRKLIDDNLHNERQAVAKGSFWAAFNAITEYVDHLPRRGGTQERKAEARFNVTQYGPGRDAKKRAWLTACKLAGVEATAG